MHFADIDTVLKSSRRIAVMGLGALALRLHSIGGCGLKVRGV
jgi:hypothetical protein